MLLSYYELCGLIEKGVIDAPMENVNGASIDVRLGKDILVETSSADLIDLLEPSSLNSLTSWSKETIDSKGFILAPGEFILASTIESFKLPYNLASEFRLRSSIARNFLNASLAMWCDPGWGFKSDKDTRLTLELQNISNNKRLILREGVRVGQMVFWHTEPVPEDKSYAKLGRYNGTESVQASLGHG
jgi:dCTP deaminase